MKRSLVPGDLVLVVDRRGFVRQVRIKTKSSCLNWPITKVCLLQEAEAGEVAAVTDDT